MSNVLGGSSNSDKEAASGDPTGRYLVYFAAERTLMAWIRAALSLMALGFVIDRFGLVVRMMSPNLGKVIRPATLSFVAGAGLVIVGALMAVVAAVRYIHFTKRYRQMGDTDPGYGLEPAIFFTVVVAVAGALITGYLLTVAP